MVMMGKFETTMAATTRATGTERRRLGSRTVRSTAQNSPGRKAATFEWGQPAQPTM